jgi:hypothetical protein
MRRNDGKRKIKFKNMNDLMFDFLADSYNTMWSSHFYRICRKHSFFMAAKQKYTFLSKIRSRYYNYRILVRELIHSWCKVCDFQKTVVDKFAKK